MPFGGKNFTETKPDLSLQSLLRFCESKPPHAPYCYHESRACLIHQFLAAQGLEGHVVNTGAYRLSPLGAPILFPGSAAWDGGSSPINQVAQGYPATFGAAAARIRALIDGRDQ